MVCPCVQPCVDWTIDLHDVDLLRSFIVHLLNREDRVHELHIMSGALRE